MSDTVLALHYLMKSGDLAPTPEALRKLATALDGSTLSITLRTMDAATKIGHDPLDVLFRAFLPHPRYRVHKR